MLARIPVHSLRAQRTAFSAVSRGASPFSSSSAAALRARGIRPCAAPTGAAAGLPFSLALSPSGTPPSASLLLSLHAHSARRSGPDQKRFSSSLWSTSTEGGLKISHLFGGLVGLGMLVTIYGLLEWYYSLQVWPEPVRTPLKSAIKAKARGDYERADAFFVVAANAARSIPPSALDPDPLLKLSGLYVTWAAMLEMHGHPVRSFALLRDAIGFFGADPLAAEPRTTAGADMWSGGSPRPLSEDERHRAIGLAQKLGQLAARMGEMGAPPPFPEFIPTGPVAVEVEPTPAKRGKEAEEHPPPTVYISPVPAGLGAAAKTWDAAAETYLSGALTAMLRIGLAARPAGDAPSPANPVVVGRDITLPHDDARTPAGDEDTAGRVNRRGLGMTMEALAAVYARQKRYDLAGHLLIQAVSTVIPPQAVSPSLEDRCQAAMLMTGVSSHALEPRTPQALQAARSWSLKALQLADSASQEAGWAGVPTDLAHNTCVRARTAAQYNLGMLDEIEKNPTAAARHFSQALNTARDAGYTEGRREANEALRRIKTQLEGRGE